MGFTPTYDVFLALKKIWVIFDFICGKRLAPFMGEAVKKLKKHKELDITGDVRKKLAKMSASTCFTRQVCNRKRLVKRKWLYDFLNAWFGGKDWGAEKASK